MNAKKWIDLAPLVDDEISLDILEELSKFVELTKTTQKVAKQLKYDQSSSLIEANEEEY